MNEHPPLLCRIRSLDSHSLRSEGFVFGIKTSLFAKLTAFSSEFPEYAFPETAVFPMLRYGAYVNISFAPFFFTFLLTFGNFPIRGFPPFSLGILILAHLSCIYCAVIPQSISTSEFKQPNLPSDLRPDRLCS